MHGGTGGLGSTAIQLAAIIGAECYATVGTEEKRAIALKLGATKVINYRTEDFVAVVREATAGKGVDVILDTVAIGYEARNIEALAKDGTVAYVSGGGGASAGVPITAIMAKRARITGSLMRPSSCRASGQWQPRCARPYGRLWAHNSAR